MPRPKPPEELFPVTYRLTRAQIRIVQEMGGVVWLRDMISNTQRHKAKVRRERNDAIAADTRPLSEIASDHHLSIKRVYAIKRLYSAP